MFFYRYIPESVKDYLRIRAARLKYPGRNIGTPYIAPGVRLGESCSLSRLVELGPDVTIGDWSYINSGTIIASGRIGRFCSVGSYCQIGMAKHPLDFCSTSPFLYGPQNIFGEPSDWQHYEQPPEIGSDVWIGANVFVAQGVTVGHGAVLGAGAVVVKDVPPYAIVVGAPARLIRYRFAPSTVDRLLASRWWDLSTVQLQAFRKEFFKPVESVTGAGQWQAADA